MLKRRWEEGGNLEGKASTSEPGAGRSLEIYKCTVGWLHSAPLLWQPPFIIPTRWKVLEHNGAPATHPHQHPHSQHAISYV